MPPDTGSKPAWETFGRPTGEHQASFGILTATPGIKEHSPPGQTDPLPHKRKQNKKLNKHGTEN
jgi:hypothetical protein